MPAGFFPAVGCIFPDDGGRAEEFELLLVYFQKLVELYHAVCHGVVGQHLVISDFCIGFGIHFGEPGKQTVEPVFPSGTVVDQHIFAVGIQVNNPKIVVAKLGQGVKIVVGYTGKKQFGFFT